MEQKFILAAATLLGSVTWNVQAETPLDVEVLKSVRSGHFERVIPPLSAADDVAPGQPFRHYIIAFVSNLGHRYADKIFASRTNFPAFDAAGPMAYTQRIPGLGKAVDAAVIKLSADRQ